MPFGITTLSKTSLALLSPITLDNLETTWSLLDGVPKESAVLHAILSNPHVHTSTQHVTTLSREDTFRSEMMEIEEVLGKSKRFHPYTTPTIYCPHCDREISYSVYNRHKKMFYNCRTKEWITLAPYQDIKDLDAEDDKVIQDAINSSSVTVTGKCISLILATRL